MQFIIDAIGIPLGYLMWFCYILIKNYGLAIILFTLLTKVLLFPVSLKVQKNSVKMVKLKPEFDRVKMLYAGDKDKIASEQIKIYDREKYSPAAGCLPLLVQIPIILGLINVIYNPLKHLLHFDKEIIDLLILKTSEILGLSNLGSAPELIVMETISNPENMQKFTELQTVFGADKINSIIMEIKNFDLNFLGINLALTPNLTEINWLLIIPILAGLTALVLCIIQNKINVLQAEQGLLSQWGMTIFMTVFSLYFAFIVPAGVGVYWIFGNVFAILQMFLLNRIYDPKKYIDYTKIKTKQPISKDEKKANKLKNKEYKTREKNDYKRFYSSQNKKLVFYSEKNGFYKYFSNVIDFVLNNSGVEIHYVTSDPNDSIFTKNTDKIKAYYISDKKLMTFMMKMDADIVVMTMPDLSKFHIKRSLVRKDIEYIYMFHYPLSTHMVLGKGALNNYDTIFCVGEFQVDEIRKWEEYEGLKQKNLVLCGYGVLEEMTRQYEDKIKIHECNNDGVDDVVNKGNKKILIAPSWQEDNILDNYIEQILSLLLSKGYDITVRPHPEYVKRFPDKMSSIVESYKDYKGDDLRFELDFSSVNSIFEADILITDWSGTGYEFSFVTKKPCLFIHTKPKINNPDYDKIDVEPLEFSLRTKVGKDIMIEDIDNIELSIQDLILNSNDYKNEIIKTRDEVIYDFYNSGKNGGEYIISRLN